jgi:exodeoxyribonuclease V alpha subunit
MLQIVRERIPARYGLDPIRYIQVLCAMNRGGPRRPLAQSRSAAGAESAGRAARRAFRLDHGIGDKVMQVENDYDKESTAATSASSAASIPRHRSW